MVSLRERLAASDTDAALRLVAEVRPKLFRKVTELRDAHLKGGGELSDRTRDSYAADARRVACCGGNPLSLAGTAASFRKLRAACLWKTREDLRECLARADRNRKKGGSGELEALCIYDECLTVLETRLIELAAMKFEPHTACRREKTHMQRQKLGRLPKDWIAAVHIRTRSGKYGNAVAVGVLIPVRPEEISNRIRITMDSTDALVFNIEGSKLRDRGAGIAAHVHGIGQPFRTIKLSAVDQTRQEAFDWLRNQVMANGGSLIVGKGLTARGMCSAFRAMSRRLFVRSKSPPSFYALRHAACAELKAAGLDPLEVARGMGHASALSQKAYGTTAQGSGGYQVKATASDPVRASGPCGEVPSQLRHNPKGQNRQSPFQKRKPRP